MLINGAKSELGSLIYGVPQWFVEPLLFLVYINDLHHDMKISPLLHFAHGT